MLIDSRVVNWSSTSKMCLCEFGVATMSTSCERAPSCPPATCSQTATIVPHFHGRDFLTLTEQDSERRGQFQSFSIPCPWTKTGCAAAMTGFPSPHPRNRSKNCPRKMLRREKVPKSLVQVYQNANPVNYRGSGLAATAPVFLLQ